MKSKLTLFQKLYQKYLRQFFVTEGREPITPNEWSEIQNLAVRELNATKGITGVKKPPFQGWNPQVIQGGKKDSDDLIKWFDELTEKKEGIGSLIKPGDVKKGVAPKTTKETLKAKKDKDLLLRDSEEDIARIKRENKQAIKDFKEKRKYDDVTKKMWKDRKVISGDSKEGREISEKLGITARPGHPLTLEGKADLKLVKTPKRDRPSIRLIKNFERDLTDIELAKEGYNLQEIGILKRARQVMKDEGQNPDDALAWVRGEMADDAGVDFEDFMTDFDWGDFPGKAEGGRIGMMYGGDPGFAFEYGGSWADWHDQHRDTMPIEQYIQTKLPKERLPFREMQSGGLAYMLGEPTYMKYGVGGSVGHAPWHKPTGHKQPPAPMDTPPPQVAGTPDPLKAPRGIPSVAPKNMDPAYMQQQMMHKAMMGRGPGTPGQGPRTMANAGGRIGFGLGGIDKGRRAFMKWLAGIMGTGVAAGTGLLKFGKVAKPAAAVTETIVKSNAAGMPAWFPHLVKRVIKEGKDETAKLGTIERQTVHTIKLPESGTPVQVTHDLVTKDVIVDIGEQTKHGWGAGRHGQPVRLELKKGEWIEPTKKGKKGIKTKDEFIVDEAEFTGGHPENVKFEESVQFKYGDHGSDFSEVEKYAIGKNKDKKIIGKQADKDAWAEGRAEVEAEDIDFAKGGLAYLLGE